MTVTPNHIQTMNNLKEWLRDNLEKINTGFSEDKNKVKVEAFSITGALYRPVFTLKKWHKESTDGKWVHTFYMNDKEIDSSHGYELWEYIEKLFTQKEDRIKEVKLRDSRDRSLNMIHQITQQVVQEDLEK